MCDNYKYIVVYNHSKATLSCYKRFNNPETSILQTN